LKTRSKIGFSQRSRLDIMACILKNSNESSRKTRLIYGCNLNLRVFNLYRKYLVSGGFLKVSRREDGVEIFDTTVKGKEFITDYKNIERILKSAGDAGESLVRAPKKQLRVR